MKTSSLVKSVGVILLAVLVGYVTYNRFETNELYSAWKDSNSKLHLKGKNVLVVGGTQGIGAGVAIRFSQLGASVTISGRNEKRANEVIETMKKEQKDSSQELRYRRVDTSLLYDVARFTDEAKKYYQERGGLHYLIQSQGFITFSKDNTTEGMDNHFTASAFSKWQITQRLLPVLKECTIYILGSYEGELDFNDIECHNKSFMESVKRNSVYVDALTKEFQTRNVDLRFYHLFPGLVKSNIFENSGFSSWFQSIFNVIADWFGRDPSFFADYPVFVATHPSEVAGARLNEKGKEIASYDWIENQQNRAILFQWSEQQEAKILKK